MLLKWEMALGGFSISFLKWSVVNSIVKLATTIDLISNITVEIFQTYAKHAPVSRDNDGKLLSKSFIAICKHYKIQ